MNIGFFGTPEIASFCLERLFEVHNISFVVTGEDKTSGRNRKINFSPVKEVALRLGIDVFQPSNLKDSLFFEKISKYDVDIYVVVAYGKIIPKNIFEFPRLQTINLHPSLLPKYRGAAPIEWSIIEGNSETGITVQMINEELDAGDIVLQEKISLNNSICSGELYDAVLPQGANMLLKAIDILLSNGFVPQTQNHSDATYCGKLNMEIAHIDWTQNGQSIHNLVRGLNPKPVAWSEFRGERIKLWETSPFQEELDLDLNPGQLYRLGKKRLLVATGDGYLEILSVQPQAKKRMDSISFLNGYRLNSHDIFI